MHQAWTNHVSADPTAGLLIPDHRIQAMLLLSHKKLFVCDRLLWKPCLVSKICLHWAYHSLILPSYQFLISGCLVPLVWITHGGSDSKASAYNVGDSRSIPGSGTSSGEGNGSPLPLQYFCLENPMDGGAWWATVHGVAKSRARLSDFTFTFISCYRLNCLFWKFTGWNPNFQNLRRRLYLDRGCLKR